MAGRLDAFEPAPRPKAITLRLVMEYSLTKSELADYNSLSADEALERAGALKAVHVEWQNIGEIAGLEPFEAAEVLYAQYNQIPRIEGLECMPKLQFLALQGNRITRVENLLCLKELEFLDLSKNYIESLDEEQLPESINILNFTENPCASADGYRERLLARLPDLAYLDGEELAPDPSSSSTALDAAAAHEQQLAAGEQGLSAYWKKSELQSGIEAAVKERIEAYSVEALADVEDVGRIADQAADRSRQRREKMERETANSSSLRAGQLTALLEAAKEAVGQAEAGQEDAFGKAIEEVAEQAAEVEKGAD